jgi:hypothetical protein
MNATYLTRPAPVPHRRSTLSKWIIGGIRITLSKTAVDRGLSTVDRYYFGLFVNRRSTLSKRIIGGIRITLSKTAVDRGLSTVDRYYFGLFVN